MRFIENILPNIDNIKLCSYKYRYGSEGLYCWGSTIISHGGRLSYALSQQRISWHRVSYRAYAGNVENVTLVCLSICLHVYLYVCLYVSVCMCLSIFIPICLLVFVCEIICTYIGPLDSWAVLLIVLLSLALPLLSFQFFFLYPFPSFPLSLYLSFILSFFVSLLLSLFL